MYFKPLFVFHFVACFKKSLYYIKVAQIGVDKLRTGWIAEHWGGFYRKYIPKDLCAC